MFSVAQACQLKPAEVSVDWELPNTHCSRLNGRNGSDLEPFPFIIYNVQ